MIDASEGVLGLQWIDGLSVRFLLGGGAEGEEVEEVSADEDLAIEEREEEDTLAVYEISQGTIFFHPYTRYSASDRADFRGDHEEDWNRDCKNAQSGCNSWRSHHLEHDVVSPSQWEKGFGERAAKQCYPIVPTNDHP